MKKAYSFRLSNEAITAIRIRAKEAGCSEAAVVEGWALAQDSSGADIPEKRIKRTPYTVGGIPSHSVVPPADMPSMSLSGIAPKGSFSLEQLKALVGANQETEESVDIMQAPFDVNIEGEPHRVRQLGKALWLVFIGEGGEHPVRKLLDGELENLWEQRIK